MATTSSCARPTSGRGIATGALRILHTESSPGWGGQEARILLESAALRARGHEVSVAGQPGSPLEVAARQRGVPFHPVRMRAPWDGLAMAALGRLIRREKVQVLHTHSSRDSWLAGLVGRALRVPAIVRTRHVSIPVRGHPLNWVYRLPHRVTTTAERIRTHLIEGVGCRPDRVRVIPTGVDLEGFGDGLSGEPFRREWGLGPGTLAVGIVANLRGSKGHSHFVEAAALLSRKRKDVRFFIVGDGPRREPIRAHIERAGMGELIRMTGYREDIPQVMAGLDLLVVASTRTEGIPQAALQALAMGVPVVGTEVGGVPEAIAPSGGGLVVPAGDAAALARAMELLLSDPGRRRAMGERGRAYVREHFGLERMVEETERLYREVLAECAR
ncbi:MAG: glycosyltransferase family 4 protein [Nitrospinota bacterium]